MSTNSDLLTLKDVSDLPVRFSIQQDFNILHTFYVIVNILETGWQDLRRFTRPFP